MYKKHEYDLVVYIGRFQPFHNGHANTLKRASKIAKNVLVLIGSSTTARSIKNPFTYSERKQMIQDSVHILNFHIDGIRDYTYDDNQWITQVGTTVERYVKMTDAKKVGIIGHDKDHSSSYLNYFPQWDFIEEPPYADVSGNLIDATKIRELMFSGNIDFISGVVPDGVWSYITWGYNEEHPWIKSDTFASLKQEWDYVQEYKKAWAGSPYPPTFVTVDAVVVQSGHILLVERTGFPAKGLLALPGGFLDNHETIRAAVVRELREETGLKVPAKVLDGSIDAYEMFDAPDRSTRGRTITHAYRITLDSAQPLPRVKGQPGETKRVKWYSFAEVEGMEDKMMEDHYHIIKHMLRLPASQVRG